MLDINELKSLLGIELDNLDYDNLLNIIINSTVSFTEKYTGLSLTQKTSTEKYIGNNDNSLYVNQVPIITVDSVAEYPIIGGNPVTVNDLTSSIEVFNQDTGLIYRNDGSLFYKGYMYEITVTYGFTEIPNDLLYAMYMLATASYGLIDGLKTGVSRLSTPDGNITYSFNLLPYSIREIFDNYKVVKL